MYTETNSSIEGPDILKVNIECFGELVEHLCKLMYDCHIENCTFLSFF